MRLALLAVVACFPVFTGLGAEEKTATCVNGDSDDLFFKTGSVPAAPEDNPDELRFPKLEYDSESNRLTGLKWTDMPHNVTATSSVIGRYNRHEIVDITYTAADSGGRTPPFVSKILAYRTGTDGTGPLMPFYIVTGETVQWYEQAFESDKDDPFSLNISVTLPGTGHIWFHYTFHFSDQAAWLEFRATGGRSEQTKGTQFSPEGKVLKTTVKEAE